ncbi:Elongation of very long chain fatty acids protein [Blattella germanica]|nr:Elongation of very long chain fatty acids protein [Blattella germanica]
MAQLVRSLVDGYHDLMDNKSDPRVNDWFLMSSPFPTLAICLSYAYFVKRLGPKIMENRKPMDLRNVLIVYNLVQVIFSAWLFYESLAAGWFNHYSYRCQPVDYSNHPRALMARGCWWYYFSKFTEFMDTVSSSSKMYSYYLLAALGPRFQKFLWWKKYLTVLQMIQFVLVMIHAFQLLFIDCNYPKAFVWWIGMHAVMFYFLFSDFYKQAYKKKQAKKQALAEAERKQKEMQQKKSNGHASSSSNGSAFYQQPKAPPSSYTTEPRHRAFVNGMDVVNSL